jgi:hypothetical protein
MNFQEELEIVKRISSNNLIIPNISNYSNNGSHEYNTNKRITDRQYVRQRSSLTNTNKTIPVHVENRLEASDSLTPKYVFKFIIAAAVTGALFTGIKYLLDHSNFSLISYPEVSPDNDFYEQVTMTTESTNPLNLIDYNQADKIAEANLFEPEINKLRDEIPLNETGYKDLFTENKNLESLTDLIKKLSIQGIIDLIKGKPLYALIASLFVYALYKVYKTYKGKCNARLIYKDIKDRLRTMSDTKVYNSGLLLTHIIDQYSQEYKYDRHAFKHEVLPYIMTKRIKDGIIGETNIIINGNEMKAWKWEDCK